MHVSKIIDVIGPVLEFLERTQLRLTRNRSPYIPLDIDRLKQLYSVVFSFDAKGTASIKSEKFTFRA